MKRCERDLCKDKIILPKKKKRFPKRIFDEILWTDEKAKKEEIN